MCFCSSLSTLLDKRPEYSIVQVVYMRLKENGASIRDNDSVDGFELTVGLSP